MHVCFRSAGALLLLGCLLTLSLREVRAQANRGAATPLEQLPKELRELSPRDYFIPSSHKKVGVIHRQEGNVVIVHGASKQAYFAMQGDPVYEKDTLVTLAETICEIQLLDGDMVTIASESEFSLESFEDQREEGRKSSFIRMLKGKAIFYAMRLFSYKDGRFTVATPTNAIGVRGTKFGVQVFMDDQKSVTDCFCEEGVVDVDGLIVASGQMYEGRTGQVIPTPAEVIRSFRDATEFKTESQTGTSSEPPRSLPPDRPITPNVSPGRPITPPSSVSPNRSITPPPQPHNYPGSHR